MKQKLITDFFSSNKKRKYNLPLNEKVYGYNYKTDSWHCLECGIDMGSCNPRQLCGKYICINN